MSTEQMIKLSYPINCQGETVSQFTMRRPTVRDRLISERNKGNEMEKELYLLANLCSMVPDDMEQLDMMDYIKLQEALNDFLS